MSDDSKNDDQEYFQTLRGFLAGKEPNEELCFLHSATLRIHGDALDSDKISDTLGVTPTHVHRKGEKRGERSPGYRDDAWHFTPAVPEERDLGEHLQALWEVVRPHVGFLKELKEDCRVDVFCGYRSNCDHAGFEVPHDALEIFKALEVPFGVSVIVC